MRVSYTLFSLSWLTLLPMGCGSQTPPVPVYAARGQVLFEGRPIPHALVVLHPLQTADDAVPRPRGKVQDDGTFVLETYTSADGAPAGEYAVTVECWLSNAKGRPGERDDAPPTNRLPARYAKAATSGLRVRVEAGENQIPTIRLSR